MKLVTIIADMADGTEVRETVGAGELLAFARIALPLLHDPACRRVRWYDAVELLAAETADLDMDVWGAQSEWAQEQRPAPAYLPR